MLGIEGIRVSRERIWIARWIPGRDLRFIRIKPYEGLISSHGSGWRPGSGDHDRIWHLSGFYQ